MLFLHYYNTSHFEQTGSCYSNVKYFMVSEIFVYWIDTLNMIFYTWVLFSAGQFHFNFNLVSGTQYVIHLVDNLLMILMRANWVAGFQNEEDPLSDFIFFWTMKCSTCLLVAAMCALPFFVIERCFASYFLRDYEVKQRKYISYILVFLLFVIGVIGAVALQDRNNTVYVMSLLIALNATAVIGNFILGVWNMKKFKNSHENIQKGKNILENYSLAQRFQIKENLMSCSLLNGIVLYMGLLNSLLVLSVLVSSFDVTPERQAICSLILEVAIFAYSFMHPQIMSNYCPKWKTQTRHFIAKVGCWRRSRKSVAPLKSISSVGIEMKGSDEMEKYFHRLNESWNKP